MPFLMALASSMFYGVADFLGGMGSRRAHVITVTAWFQLTGVFLLVAYALLAPGETRTADLVWASIAGVGGGLGVTLLYHVLATGTVSTAAPLVSMVALTVPVVVGLASGEQPGALPLIGIALGALAVWLVSGGASHGGGSGGGEHAAPHASPFRALALAVLAGLLIGGFLVCLARVQPGLPWSRWRCCRAERSCLRLALTCGRPKPPQGWRAVIGSSAGGTRWKSGSGSRPAWYPAGSLANS